MHQFGLDADELANALEAAGSGPAGATPADLHKARQALAKQAAKNPRRSSAITPDSMGPRFDASTIHGARAVSDCFLACELLNLSLAHRCSTCSAQRSCLSIPVSCLQTSPTLTGSKRPAAAMAGGSSSSSLSPAAPTAQPFSVRSTTTPVGAAGSAAAPRTASGSPTSPSSGAGGAPAGAVALYAKRTNAGQVVDSYSPDAPVGGAGAGAAAAGAGAGARSPGAALTSPAKAASLAAMTGAGPCYARIPLAQLQARGFVLQAPVSELTAKPLASGCVACAASAPCSMLACTFGCCSSSTGPAAASRDCCSAANHRGASSSPVALISYPVTRFHQTRHLTLLSVCLFCPSVPLQRHHKA